MQMKVNRPARTASAKGFTLMELVVVMAITVTGFVAALYLQSSLMKGASNSWDTTCAVQLARHTLETIRLEAVEWYNDTGAGVGGVQQLKFAYLRNVGAATPGGTSGWQRAPYANSALPFQLTNQLGDNVGWDEGANDEITNAVARRYSVQYRLTWIVPNMLIRAETRVMWPRTDMAAGNYDTCPADMFNHPNDIMSVTIPMTVMKNVFVSP